MTTSETTQTILRGKNKVIPFFSFSMLEEETKQLWLDSVAKLIGGGQFIGGPMLHTFEESWARYTGATFCAGVGNGYDALYLALKSLHVGPGSFVAVPAHTFIATWLAVDATGATVVGVDCDENGQISLDALEEVTNKIDAVIAVHMHGMMTNMNRLTEWCRENRVKLVEDCAQAHGAKQFGKHAGTFGDAGAFSFYPTKNLGALGDAGAVVSNSQIINSKVKSLSNYGSSLNNKYEYETSEGVN
jgi:dTDP-4-amino-4,6-dideoxygalactose transaminase